MFEKLKSLFFGKKEDSASQQPASQQSSKQLQEDERSVIKRAKKYRKEASYR
jgi:hypothetical protein